MTRNKQIKRIGILTGGGDCPGLNAVIRGVTKPALDHGLKVLGILDGFEGLVTGKAVELYDKDVSGILFPYKKSITSGPQELDFTTSEIDLKSESS
jgi:hypothetical protein